jgi:hypothetical protein
MARRSAIAVLPECGAPAGRRPRSLDVRPSVDRKRAHAARHGPWRVVVLPCVAGVLLGCSDRSATDPGDNGDNGNGPDPEPYWDIAQVASAPDVSRLVARDGALYWLDSSEEPIRRYQVGDPAHTSLFRSTPIPERAVSDGQHAYWLGGGSLFRTTMDGATTTVLHEGQRDLGTGVTSQILFDDAHVYWVGTVASGECSPACTFTIHRLSKSGGTAATLVTTRQSVVALALAEGHLFWQEIGTGPVAEDGSTGSMIWKLSLADGVASRIVDGLLNGLMEPPGPGYVPASWHPRGGIATDGATVYFADASFVDRYRLMSVSAAGGDVAVLAEVVSGDPGIFVRDMYLGPSTLYWITPVSLKALSRSGGVPVELAGGLAGATSLAGSGTTLFWLETLCCGHGQKGSIRSLSTSGGSPVLVQGEIDAPAAIATDATAVFWVEGNAMWNIEGFGRVARVAHGGGSLEVLVESAEGGPFDVDATHAYFADRFTVKRVLRGGGRVERLAIGNAPIIDLATDGVRVYWVEDAGFATLRSTPVQGGAVSTHATGDGPGGLVRVDASAIYWMGRGNVIRRVPKTGGTEQTLVALAAGGITDFVVAGGYLLYSEWDGSRIVRIPSTGGESLVLQTLRIDGTRRLGSDGARLYWIDQLDLAWVPVSGGDPEFIIHGAVASSPFRASPIAVDGPRLFWAEVAAGAIMTATREQ